MSAVVRPRGATALFEWLRRQWPISLSCRSDTRFAFAVSYIWLAFYNFSFWRQTFAAMWTPSLGSTAFMASVLVLVWCLQALLLLLMPTRLLMRAAASALFVVAALSSYFTQAYGALMNRDMLRNALQTDAAEVSGLLSLDLLLYFIVLGVLPAVLVWKVVLPPVSWRRQIRQRIYVIGGALVLAAGGVLGCSANYAVYLRAHKPIRFALSPAAAVSSAVGLVSQAGRSADELPIQDPGGMAHRVEPPTAKPMLLFIVIGETARAANFQLGGYARPTTPQLAGTPDLVYFGNATACGTSTAISVPCMFSHLDRKQFDVDEAGRYTNLLDSLMDAGFDVEWRDNNAGCKGVCARVRTTEYSSRPVAHLCEHSYCYDEIMLEDLASRIRDLKNDTVIVFHQIGSHGPAYFERYPAEFERFKPSCRSKELQRCSEQEVINAYDNTIAYTDHVLARQIDILRTADRIDSVLVYASDHGESLGEQGVYLHGMPYAFAPDAQKRVPTLLWASAGYRARTKLDMSCLRRRASQPTSHDNLYHTILGAARVRDSVYQPSLDVLSDCRRAAGVEPA